MLEYIYSNNYFSGTISHAIIYAKSPGPTAVKRQIATYASSTKVGAKLKYSASPPQIPAIFLLF